MKKLKKIFTAEKRAYFHHKHGIYFRKNRKKQTALWASGLLSLCGCFLFVSTFLIPLIKSSNYFQQRVDSSQSQQNQEVTPKDKKLEPISRNNSELEVIVNNALADIAGSNTSWSVYIYDLKDDSTVQINSDEKLDAASLYKLFLTEQLEQKLPYNEWANTWLKEQSIADCVYNMLQSTDDPCSEDLADYLGLEEVDKYNQENGYKNTSFSGNYGKQTTASDVGKFFVSLKKSQALSDSARRFVFDALYQQHIDKGVSKGCGKNCRTANKQGELSDIAYDAGVVTHGKRDYVLVVMSQGGSFKKIAKLTKVIDEYLR